MSEWLDTKGDIGMPWTTLKEKYAEHSHQLDFDLWKSQTNNPKEEWWWVAIFIYQESLTAQHKFASWHIESSTYEGYLLYLAVRQGTFKAKTNEECTKLQV